MSDQHEGVLSTIDLHIDSRRKDYGELAPRGLRLAILVMYRVPKVGDDLPNNIVLNILLLCGVKMAFPHIGKIYLCQLLAYSPPIFVATFLFKSLFIEHPNCHRQLAVTVNPFLPDCKTTFSWISYIFLCYFKFSNL